LRDGWTRHSARLSSEGASPPLCRCFIRTALP
jgi:hypothetical protein